MAIDLSGINFSNAKDVEIQLDEFKGGTNTLVKESRLKPSESPQSTNLMLVQDGLWTKRWGTDMYGADAGGSSVDGFGEYVTDAGVTELIVVTNGKVYKMTTTATEITGATFTSGTPAHLLQIGGYLYIANGTDPLARYDGSDLLTYTAITTPVGGGVARGAGLSAGDYTYYYQITALNSVGETTGSSELSITVDALREGWVVGDDDYIDVSWTAVSGATRYQVYMSDESGYETLLAEAATNSYRDDASKVANPYIEVPDDNTTGGPLFTHMDISNNRLWSTGDPDNKFRVYWTGTGVNLGTFSDYYGGGWIDLEKGGRNEPVAVVHYQDGQGTGIATVFCSTPDGDGSIWQISLDSLTVEETTFVVPTAKKLVGSIGTDAPKSVVKVQNDIYFFNKKGVFVLGNEPNFWGILRSNELSARIRPYIESLDDASLSKVCGYYYDAKVFFSVPTSSAGNSQTFYYDRERLSWVKEWTVGVSHFGQYTDSDDITHFLGGKVDDGYLVKFSSGYQGDEGVAFSTTYLSPRIPIAKDWTDFAKMRKSYVRLSDMAGAIEFEVLGTTKRAGFSSVGAETIIPTTSGAGLGWDLMGTTQMGDSEGFPTTFASGNEIRRLKINQRLRDIQFSLSTNTLDAEYTLLGIRAEGFPVEVSDPSTWKLA